MGTWNIQWIQFLSFNYLNLKLKNRAKIIIMLKDYDLIPPSPLPPPLPPKKCGIEQL